jgi:hypothetical protein
LDIHNIILGHELKLFHHSTDPIYIERNGSLSMKFAFFLTVVYCVPAVAVAQSGRVIAVASTAGNEPIAVGSRGIRSNGGVIPNVGATTSGTIRNRSRNRNRSGSQGVNIRFP